MKPFYVLLLIIAAFFAQGIYAESNLLLLQATITPQKTEEIPADTFLFTHGLFGLKINQSVSDIQVYEPAPSPFKQPDSYLLTKPPISNSMFPIVVATITEETGLCRISGSFAVEKESPETVQTLIQFVMHFSNTLGPPSTTDSGHILWQNVPNNALNIKHVSILTDQLPEDITLITISYDLSNQDNCPVSVALSDAVDMSDTDKTDKTAR